MFVDRQVQDLLDQRELAFDWNQTKINLVFKMQDRIHWFMFDTVWVWNKSRLSDRVPELFLHSCKQMVVWKAILRRKTEDQNEKKKKKNNKLRAKKKEYLNGTREEIYL